MKRLTKQQQRLLAHYEKQTQNKEGETMWRTNRITIETPTKKETYTYWAKVYEEGSIYGIDEGRISKLEVRDSEGRMVINYDRGWDTEPKNVLEQAALQAIKNLYN